MNKKIFILFILLVAAFSQLVKSQQVGINTNEPNTLTVLDVQTATGNDGVIDPKGIMIPRLTQEQRDNIDISNEDMANSLLIYNLDEDCFNYYSKTEKRWKSICGEESSVSVVTDANCALMKINGSYEVGKSLSNSEHIQISVIVSKSGTYEIKALPEVNNGYFFFASGVFLAAGSSVLTIPGLGTPINATTDNIILSINGIPFCEKELLISPSDKNPEYTIDCSVFQISDISGRFVSGQVIPAEQNSVLVTINATDEAIGSAYEIQTEQKNGYYFYGKGIISQNIQKVALYASGTPINAGTDNFTIITNSDNQDPGSACSFNIKVASRAVTILGVGENNTYYLGANSNGMNLLLNNPKLFGPTQISQVPVGGFNILKPGAGNNVNLAQYIESYNPDIIIIMYNWIAGNYGSSNLQALTDFVNNNGVLILCSDGDGINSSRNIRCQNIINAIFDGANFQNTGVDDINTALLPSEGESLAPVLKGPFMDLRGLSIARDAGNNFNFTNLPADAEVVAYGSSGEVRSFMHLNKGFFFLGDGAPFAYSANNTSPYNYPMKLDRNYDPIANTYSNPTTYNAHLFCNIMAWAIYYIENNKRK